MVATLIEEAAEAVDPDPVVITAGPGGDWDTVEPGPGDDGADDSVGGDQPPDDGDEKPEEPGDDGGDDLGDRRHDWD